MELRESPHAPGVGPVRIHYREGGAGRPIVYLHGGWGYLCYPIDDQLRAFGRQYRFLMPDRSGHGLSTPVAGEMPVDFHQRAATETFLFMDAMQIDRSIVWGHSDGAVIGAFMALTHPERCERLILEAFHYFREKNGSREFFSRAAASPLNLGERTRNKLSADHGETYWPHVVRRNARVWLRIGQASTGPQDDLFGGKLRALRVPVLFVHGRKDPRTEPGEIERASQSIPGCEVHFIENGTHCPHNEAEAVEEFNAAARTVI